MTQNNASCDEFAWEMTQFEIAKATTSKTWSAQILEKTLLAFGRF